MKRESSCTESEVLVLLMNQLHDKKNPQNHHQQSGSSMYSQVASISLSIPRGETQVALSGQGYSSRKGTAT